MPLPGAAGGGTVTIAREDGEARCRPMRGGNVLAWPLPSVAADHGIRMNPSDESFSTARSKHEAVPEHPHGLYPNTRVWVPGHPHLDMRVLRYSHD